MKEKIENYIDNKEVAKEEIERKYQWAKDNFSFQHIFETSGCLVSETSICRSELVNELNSFLARCHVRRVSSASETICS